MENDQYKNGSTERISKQGMLGPGDVEYDEEGFVIEEEKRWKKK